MTALKTGLKENLNQFILLVLVNAFVGGMVGLERSILPVIAQQTFQLEGNTLLLSFILVFGTAKAISNYFTGYLASFVGRKNLLVIGWLFALPVPFLLMFANDWHLIVLANLFLGIQQGLCWSSTVIMKIDLVGEKNRGLAMGLNEFAGYLSIALVAYLTSIIAHRFGIRPYPFYTGLVLVALGLLFSIFLIRDTKWLVATEGRSSDIPRLKNIFLDTSFRHKNLSSVTQAGLVNNLNDGMVWGLFPILLASKNFNLTQIGIITAIYPASWGISQLYTGRLSDLICRKKLLFWGMLLQGLTILLLPLTDTFWGFVFLSIALGWGTALVYPTFMVAVSEETHPYDRAKSLGVFRFWRDLGYALGAIVTGYFADVLGIPFAIIFIGAITICSALLLQQRMSCHQTVYNPFLLKRLSTTHPDNSENHFTCEVTCAQTTYPFPL
jgi:MFS family permease